MLLQDLRFALRTHLKRPGFAAIAVLTLALGIGANTALFSIVNALLLQPLPYPESDRLVRIYGTNEARGLTRSNFNPNDLLDVRERAETIAGAAYYSSFTATLPVEGEPTRLLGGLVHSSFFEVLGAQPHMGRFFTEDENIAGNDLVIVLSHSAWTNFFGADPDIVGKQLAFSDPHTIIGVAPADFRDPFSEPAMWGPWARDPENRGGHFMRGVARVRPGIALEAAQQEVDAVFAGIAEEHDKPQRGLALVPLHESIVHDDRTLLLMLFGAVGFLLLIVCANVASLMLARAANRQQEVAVRMALGAGRARLVRQLVTESVLLAGAAGATGIMLAYAIIALTAETATAGMPSVFEVRIDVPVMAFCVAVTLASGILFGLAPALHGTRAELADSLRERGADAGAGRRRLRGALVVIEVALSLVLLVGAGLMLRSLGNLTSIDPGFDPEDVLTFRMSVPSSDYPDVAQVPVFYEELMARLEALPGVVSVGATNRLPFSGSFSCDFFMLEGWPPPERGQGRCAEERVIAGRYFETLGIDIVEGRDVGPDDRAESRDVIVVSETMARRHMSDGETLDRGFTWGMPSEDNPFRRVVGVAGDVKHVDLVSESMTEVYMPHRQSPYYRTMFVAVRAPDAETLVPAVRNALREQDRNIPIYSVAMLEERVAESFESARNGARLLGSFAALALVFACVGLYGVLAYTVSQRSHELGVRMALGARAPDVVSMVLRQALELVAFGLALGLAGAWLLSGTLSSLLYEVEPGDPLTFLAVAATLLAVSLAAAYVPAARATHVDPVRALRED